MTISVLHFLTQTGKCRIESINRIVFVGLLYSTFVLSRVAFSDFSLVIFLCDRVVLRVLVIRIVLFFIVVVVVIEIRLKTLTPIVVFYCV